MPWIPEPRTQPSCGENRRSRCSRAGPVTQANPVTHGADCIFAAQHSFLAASFTQIAPALNCPGRAGSAATEHSMDAARCLDNSERSTFHSFTVIEMLLHGKDILFAKERLEPQLISPIMHA